MMFDLWFVVVVGNWADFWPGGTPLIAGILPGASQNCGKNCGRVQDKKVS
jgi:hypothetical protein